MIYLSILSKSGPMGVNKSWIWHNHNIDKRSFFWSYPRSISSSIHTSQIAQIEPVEGGFDIQCLFRPFAYGLIVVAFGFSLISLLMVSGVICLGLYLRRSLFEVHFFDGQVSKIYADKSILNIQLSQFQSVDSPDIYPKLRTLDLAELKALWIACWFYRLSLCLVVCVSMDVASMRTTSVIDKSSINNFTNFFLFASSCVVLQCLIEYIQQKKRLWKSSDPVEAT